MRKELEQRTSSHALKMIYRKEIALEDRI